MTTNPPLTTPIQRRDVARVWPSRLSSVLIVLLGSVLGISYALSPLPIRAVAILAFSVQLIVTYRIALVSDRLLTVSSLFAVLWMVYFPLRLLIITFGGRSIYYFPAVNSASVSELVWVWEVTTGALLAFYIGQLFSHRTLKFRSSIDNLKIGYGQYLFIALFGIGITAGLYFLHASSGILGNLGEIALFGIGGASYIESKTRSRRYGSVPFVCAAVAFGYANGFKQLALMPVLAWFIGRIGAGARIRVRHLITFTLFVIITFAIVQGERSERSSGSSASNPVSALGRGLADYNLAYGVPEHYTGLSILGNAIDGILYRLKGADYFIAIVDRVPSSVPFQNGRSLWEPAMSIVPGHQRLFALEPQYDQLSLGRYVDQEFVSQQPTNDPSSQSMTAPGDLYLNFGTLGILIGMFLIGVLYRGFDRSVPLKGSVSAGLIAFVGLALIDLDGNLAYVIVTFIVRLSISGVLFMFLLPAQRRLTPQRMRTAPLSTRLTSER